MVRGKRVFCPEFREDAVKLVIDSSRPVAQVARELGIGEATLGNWVNKYRRDHAGEEAPLSVSDRARLREETGVGAIVGLIVAEAELVAEKFRQLNQQISATTWGSPTKDSEWTW